jgi:xylulokinase
VARSTLVAGVDCSTQGTKVLVLDSDSGAVVATGTARHDVVASDGASETDPASWTAALASAMAATRRGLEISAISVAGQQHGLVVADDKLRPLRRAILWNDTRSAGCAQRLSDDMTPAWWAQRVGSVPIAAITVAKWAWLREREAQTAAATAAVRLPHDWLTQILCGAPVTDRGDASGTGWWSVGENAYAQDVLEHPMVRLDPRLLPEVAHGPGAVGEVHADAARTFGLRSGTLVARGTGDNMAAALGLGIAPGVPVISLGTSGTAYARSARPAEDATGIVASFADTQEHHLPLACTLNATLAVERFASWLGLGRDDCAIDSGGVIVLPFLDGERTPNLPNASGLIHGLRHNTTPQQILTAAYEGVVVSLLQGLHRVVELCGDVGGPLHVVGGGARSAAWIATLSRLGGRPLRVPRARELAALGAAVQAAAALTGEDERRIATRWNGAAGEDFPATAADGDGDVMRRNLEARALVHAAH